MKNIILYSLSALFFLVACSESAEIKVKNLVHNASLEDISYGDYSIGYNLYPGETSESKVIYDDPGSWPKAEQIEFYMVRDGNMVYLKTAYAFTLNAGDKLQVIISDTTQVISPFGKKSLAGDLPE